MGTTYLYGGNGNDRLYSNSYFSFNSNDTIVIHQGSGGTVLDLGGNDTYVFVGDGTSGSGSVSILELPDGGFDTLDFSQWASPVTVDLSSTEPQIVSVDKKGNPILTLRLFYAGTIENLVLPGEP